MAQVKFNKVAALPGVLAPDTFYFILNGDYAEGYLTNAAGEAKSIGNSTMINSLIAQALADFDGGSATDIVPDIAARNALTAIAGENRMILVLDATGDPTVAAGSALYAFSFSAQQTYKVAEYESMDVVVQWANIQGRPNSTPAQIDSAVSAAHSHANKAVLDQFSADAEGPLYNGAGINPRWGVNNW